MRLKVEVSLPPTGEQAEPARVWLRSFESWLEVVPQGVTVKIHEVRPDRHSDMYVDVTEAKEFFKGKVKPARVHYNGRSVFFWLVENMHQHLEVRCRRCQERYGVCNCEASGYERWGDGPDEWGYGYLSPRSCQYEDVWVIGRDSLRKLPMVVLDDSYDISDTRRERVRAFVMYVKGA